MLQCVEAYGSVLHCTAVCSKIFAAAPIFHTSSVLQYVLVCCSTLQNVAVKVTIEDTQHNATQGQKVQDPERHCNTPQHTAAHADSMRKVSQLYSHFS